LIAGIALCATLSVPAHGQADTSVDSANSAPPINIARHGGAELDAHDMLVAMRLEQRQRDTCWEFGCLVIVNESKNFLVTGFFVATGERNGKVQWSSNQFGPALQPRHATFRFKSGLKDCERQVRFTARNIETREKVEVQSVASLCKSPHVDSLIRLRIERPEVIVGS
jgi:hypothetical protein